MLHSGYSNGLEVEFVVRSKCQIAPSDLVFKNEKFCSLKIRFSEGINENADLSTYPRANKLKSYPLKEEYHPDSPVNCKNGAMSRCLTK